MEYIVKKKIELKATPDKVWQALTDPEKTKEYFYNCRVFSDWQEGSPITFKGKLFWVLPIELKGQILRAEPGKLLQYTLKNRKDTSSNFSTVTDELYYANGQTTLYITDDVGQGEGAEKRYERSMDGWDEVLEGLKELVEKDAQ